MIAIDTNVLVRFLTQDDPDQARAATEFMNGLRESDPGFIGREVMVELVWVLERAYGFGRAHHRVIHFVNRHPGIRVAVVRQLHPCPRPGFIGQRPLACRLKKNLAIR